MKRPLMLLAAASALLAGCGSSPEEDKKKDDEAFDRTAVNTVTGLAVALDRCGADRGISLTDLPGADVAPDDPSVEALGNGFRGCDTTDLFVEKKVRATEEDDIRKISAKTSLTSWSLSVLSNSGATYTIARDGNSIVLSCEGDGTDCDGENWEPSDPTASLQQLMDGESPLAD